MLYNHILTFVTEHLIILCCGSLKVYHFDTICTHISLRLFHIFHPFTFGLWHIFCYIYTMVHLHCPMIQVQHYFWEVSCTNNMFLWPTSRVPHHAHVPECMRPIIVIGLEVIGSFILDRKNIYQATNVNQGRYYRPFSVPWDKITLAHHYDWPLSLGTTTS